MAAEVQYGCGSPGLAYSVLIGFVYRQAYFPLLIVSFLLFATVNKVAYKNRGTCDFVQDL